MTDARLNDWRFERVTEREIRITDPVALAPIIITLDDQALVMRTLWRLCAALIASPAAAVTAQEAPPRIVRWGHCWTCNHDAIPGEGCNRAACPMTATAPHPSQAPTAAPQTWRDHVEDRLRTWRQRTMNRSGDRLALDDFMDSASLEDLIDFVCDEYAAPQPAPAVRPENLPTKEHIRELAQEALDQIMEQAQVFASAWSLVGGKFDSGNAMSDAEDAKAELRTMVRSLADLAAETVRPLATPAPAEGDDILEPLIYAAMMHNGTPKTVVDFERAAANVTEMLERRGTAQPALEALPHPGSLDADEMIDELLAEYGHPANAKNAARAGYMAARRLLQHARQPLPAVDDAAAPATQANVQPKGMPAEWLDAFEEWRQTLGAADLDGKRDLVWRHIAGTGFQAGAAWARSQAPAPVDAELTERQIERAWRLGFRAACDAERLNATEEWGYKGANVIEEVDGLAGRTNRGDETGGAVKRFGWAVAADGKHEIVPATNGAFVWYDDYLTLWKAQAPAVRDEPQDIGGHIRAAANARVAQQADDDTRRLDYLQKKQATISLGPDGSDKNGTCHAFMVGGWHCSVNRDVRASIDAAMEASKPPVQPTAAPEPIRCPERVKNGGTCPHHNLQCGWPACNKETP